MKGLLSKIEYIVIGIFAIIFLMWAVSKCNSHKEQALEDAAIEAREDSLANAANQPAPVTPQPAPTPVADTSKTPAATPQPEKVQETQGSKLYVTIDKLKIRKTPGLDGDLLGELKLFDEVYYQDEVTDSLYTVNLGREEATEPYVKVKTKRGTIGWVYGAGVHYVKKKRSGVLE